MAFRDSLRKMEAYTRQADTFGVGAAESGVIVLLNGAPITATTSPIEDTQPFALSPGQAGYTDMPTMRIALARAVWLELKAATLGKNRFTVGTLVMRVVKLSDDPLSSEVACDCASVDI